MTQGSISSWKKSPGDELKPGDILCDIETDKASVGFEVFHLFVLFGWLEFYFHIQLDSR